MRASFLPCFTAFALATIGAATPTRAQDTAREFEGGYVGAEAGLYDQHFYLETGGVGTARRGYQRNWSYAGGVFGGYDISVAPKLRLGAELGATLGGGTNTALFSATEILSYRSRYGYRLVLRGGFVVTPRLLLYANGGYGGNRYKITNTAGVGNVHDWGSSFIVGAGAEYRLSPHLGLRFDVKHLDNESSQFFVGLPVRF